MPAVNPQTSLAPDLATEPRPKPVEEVASWSADEVVPVLAIVVIAAILVALCVLYVAEYARIAAEGYQQAKLHQAIARLERANAEIRQQIAARQHPAFIAQQAPRLGLIQGSPSLTVSLPEDLTLPGTSPAPREKEPALGQVRPMDAPSGR